MSAIASIWVVLVQLRNMPSASGRSCCRASSVQSRGVTLTNSSGSSASRHVVHDGKAARFEIVDHGLVTLVGAEQNESVQPERLQGVAHEAARRQRLDSARIMHDVENAPFALRSLRHGRVGAVKHDQVGRNIGEKPRGACDLVPHLRQRPFPRAGNARTGDVHGEAGRRKAVELRLGDAVDGGNDHADFARTRGARRASAGVVLSRAAVASMVRVSDRAGNPPPQGHVVGLTRIRVSSVAGDIRG